MKRFLLLILGGLLLSNIANAQRRVVDGIDDTPLSSATIFDAQGNVAGFTTSEGDFSKIADSAYPITIRCIGYENIILEHPKDTVLQMIPAIYELEEAVVSAKRDVMKQTFYVREYFTLSANGDTVTYFMEYMADRYVPASKKVKFSKNSLRMRNSRCYSHFKIGDMDSVAVSATTTIPSVASLAELDTEELDVSSFFQGQKGVNRVYEKKGKSGNVLSLKQNARTFTEVEDMLANKKNHSSSIGALALVGLSIEMNKVYSTHVYHANDASVYLPKDLIQASFMMGGNGKGKLWRMMLNSDTPVKILSVAELYVVDREYLSKEQANEEYKNKKLKVAFQVPPTVPQLSPATRQLIKRAEQK